MEKNMEHEVDRGVVVHGDFGIIGILQKNTRKIVKRYFCRILPDHHLSVLYTAPGSLVSCMGFRSTSGLGAWSLQDWQR